MEEDIKILEEFIKEPQAEYEEVYVDGKLISKLELLPIDFKPTKEVSQALENLLKAYKQDEKMIKLIAEEIKEQWNVELNVEYFRKKLENE